MVAICQAERIVPRSGGDDKIKENVARNLKHYSDFDLPPKVVPTTELELPVF